MNMASGQDNSKDKGGEGNKKVGRNTMPMPMPILPDDTEEQRSMKMMVNCVQNLLLQIQADKEKSTSYSTQQGAGCSSEGKKAAEKVEDPKGDSGVKAVESSTTVADLPLYDVSKTGFNDRAWNDPPSMLMAPAPPPSLASTCSQSVQKPKSASPPPQKKNLGSPKSVKQENPMMLNPSEVANLTNTMLPSVPGRMRLNQRVAFPLDGSRPTPPPTALDPNAPPPKAGFMLQQQPPKTPDSDENSK